MNAVKEQPAVVESTAAERLETARAGLKQLSLYQSAATERKSIAASQLERFSAKLQELHRAKDLEGADVDLAISSVTEQRNAAAKAIAAASVDIVEYTKRISAVNAEIPKLEAAAMQDELAELVAAGREAAKKYREAIEAVCTTGVAFQEKIRRAAVLEDAISRRGFAPRHSLKAHLIDGAQMDHLWRVAKDVDGNPATVSRATQDLFVRWRL